MVLLCYLCSLMHASERSSEGLSHNSAGPDPSTSLLVHPTPLRDEQIFTSFINELTLEIISLAVISVAITTNFTCSTPTLLTAALSLTVVLYAVKIGIIIPRTKALQEPANAAGGLGCRTPTLQAIVSLVSVAADFSRACALLSAVIKSLHCKVGAHAIAASLSNTLLAIFLLGLLQAGIPCTNMIIWSRDKKERLPDAALQA